MLPSVFPLLLAEGTLLIGPPFRLDEAAGEWSARAADPYRGRLPDLLARLADSARLRQAAVAWGIEAAPRPSEFGGLSEDIARLVETGSLDVRFLPRFRSGPDLSGDGVAGDFRLYQLGSGPDVQRATFSRPPKDPPRPPITRPRSTTSAEKDFVNETAQAETHVAAARNGTPFCEICEKARRG